VEDEALLAKLYFEGSLDLNVITLGQGRRPLSINNHAAASSGTRQIERHLFVAVARGAFLQPANDTLDGKRLMIELRRVCGHFADDVGLCRTKSPDERKQYNKGSAC
jgi:hypothetical protein